MQETWTIDVMWWISAFLSLMEREVRELDEQRRANLDAFKLEVAKSYASITALKDVERRLTSHLVRIEQKLDGAQFTQHPERR